MVHKIQYWADAHFFNVSRVVAFAKLPENDKFIIKENGNILVSTWWSNELADAYKKSVPAEVLKLERQESLKRQHNIMFGENV